MPTWHPGTIEGPETISGITLHPYPQLDRLDPTSSQARELVVFIREGLGCGCPDATLSDLQLDSEPSQFSGLPVDRVLLVGGRLVIGFCEPNALGQISKYLRQCVEAGKQTRDQGGYNRFRLVLPIPDGHSDIDKEVIQDSFTRLCSGDERMHIHLVDVDEIPSHVNLSDRTSL